MSTATLNLNVITKRMLTKSEAASHCGRPLKRFISECPVAPIKFENGDERYDVRDLDSWLDSLKIGDREDALDSIVERL